MSSKNRQAELLLIQLTVVVFQIEHANISSLLLDVRNAFALANHSSISWLTYEPPILFLFPHLCKHLWRSLLCCRVLYSRSIISSCLTFRSSFRLKTWEKGHLLKPRFMSTEPTLWFKKGETAYLHDVFQIQVNLSLSQVINSYKH